MTTSDFLGYLVDFSVNAENRTGHMIIKGPRDGVSLYCKGEPLLTLQASYRCSLDRDATYLSVAVSCFSVHVGDTDSTEPLYRYDFVRDLKAVLPSAHLQIHAHRSQMGFAMGMAAQRQAARRGPTGKGMCEQAELKRLHFPLGGARFRPCLEDVLGMLVSEFDIDRAPGWEEVLEEGRAKWRRVQAAAVVRDCPDVAISTLEAMGHRVVIDVDRLRVENKAALTGL